VSERTPIERLAIVQALYNVVGKMVSTKDPDNLRAEVDDQMRALYEVTGAKSFDVKVNGTKVGAYSVVISKPTEATTEEMFAVLGYGELFEWDVPVEEAVSYARDHLREFARWYFEETGELPPGCALVTDERPGDPGGRIKSTRLSIDAEKVSAALGNELGSVTRALLEGGTNG